jgi:hypothetical protein
VAIELNRRFVECQDDEKSDPDLVARFGRTEATRGWNDLVKLRRVVFLAEAGSGKTTEMTARARQQLESGHPSFYAPLEDVARGGLESSLRPADRTRLAAWLGSSRTLGSSSTPLTKRNKAASSSALRSVPSP